MSLVFQNGTLMTETVYHKYLLCGETPSLEASTLLPFGIIFIPKPLITMKYS